MLSFSKICQFLTLYISDWYIQYVYHITETQKLCRWTYGRKGRKRLNVMVDNHSSLCLSQSDPCFVIFTKLNSNIQIIGSFRGLSFLVSRKILIIITWINYIIYYLACNRSSWHRRRSGQTFRSQGLYQYVLWKENTI